MTEELIIFRERENFQGKSEKGIFLNCKKCPKYKGKVLNNQRCISCFFNTLYKVKGKRIKYLSLEIDNCTLEKKQIDLFLEYFKEVKKIKELFEAMEQSFAKVCLFYNAECDCFPDKHTLFDIKSIFNPFELYVHSLEQVSKIAKLKEVKNASCWDCRNMLIACFREIINTLNKFKIVKDYKVFAKKTETIDYTFFIKVLFAINIGLPKPEDVRRIAFPKKKIKDDKLLEKYLIGENELFQIMIHDVVNQAEKIYNIGLSFRSKEEETFYKKVVNDVTNHLREFKLEEIISFEDLMEEYMKEATFYLKSKYKFTPEEQRKISILATLKSINLAKLFPLLLDDYIEEIFLDTSDSCVYINHQTYGRCRTDMIFNKNEIERLKTFFRLYSGQRLDYSNPSIKFVMKNKYFYCRFTIDTEPIHAFNFSLDIRKLNKNIFTIQDLLKNKTLSPLIASFIYFNILHRKNITSTGETDTGKTTLNNAFDLLTPKDFRKVYVENAIESLNQANFEKHQLKYKVDSLEDIPDKKYSKHNQIKKLLHRSPDIIYLGEILTKEEAEALFECLASGLRGFQTIHSNTIESLINRFLFHFKIDKSCLNDLDLIILMKKDIMNKRRIVQIAEIQYNDNNTIDLDTIFKYNPDGDDWDIIVGDLYNTKVIRDLRSFEKIDQKEFWRYINIYKKIFESLIVWKKIPNENFIEFFHEVSHLSRFPIEKLEEFWGELNQSTYFNRLLKIDN